MSVVAPPWEMVWRFPVMDFVRRVNTAWPPGAVASSWYRSPRVNVQEGGSGPRPYGVGGPLSQHLVGLAVDLEHPNMEMLKRDLQKQGLVAIVESDHVHAQLWPRGTLDRLLGF